MFPTAFAESETHLPLWNAVFLAKLTAVAPDTTNRFSVSVTATTTTASETLTSVSDTTRLQIGMVVTGTGIPTGTTITAFDATTITMSQYATANGTVTVTAAFYLYDWTEQTYDTGTGAAVAANGGRSGSYALSPAIEANNQKLTVPTLAWLRYRSAPTGEVVYEFFAGAEPNADEETICECLAAALTNITLSGTQTIDGVALSAGDRVLLVAQTLNTQNGPWIVQSNAWTRPPEYASGATIGAAFLVLVAGGDICADTAWMLDGTSSITVDLSNTTWDLANRPGYSVCKAVATANHATSGTATIDGVALVANDRVLLTAQTTTSDNGPWLVQSGAWIRPPEFLAGRIIPPGFYATIDWQNNGLTTVNGATTWYFSGTAAGSPCGWTCYTNSTNPGAISLSNQYIGKGIKRFDQVQTTGDQLIVDPPTSTSYGYQPSAGTFTPINDFRSSSWNVAIGRAAGGSPGNPALVIYDEAKQLANVGFDNCDMTFAVVIDGGNPTNGYTGALATNNNIKITNPVGDNTVHGFQVYESSKTFYAELGCYSSDPNVKLSGETAGSVAALAVLKSYSLVITITGGYSASLAPDTGLVISDPVDNWSATISKGTFATQNNGNYDLYFQGAFFAVNGNYAVMTSAGPGSATIGVSGTILFGATATGGIVTNLGSNSYTLPAGANASGSTPGGTGTDFGPIKAGPGGNAGGGSGAAGDGGTWTGSGGDGGTGTATGSAGNGGFGQIKGGDGGASGGHSAGGTGGPGEVTGGTGGAGTATQPAGPGGSIVITSGGGGANNGGGGGASGSLTVDVGVPTGLAPAGALSIGTTNATSITIGNSNAEVAINAANTTVTVTGGFAQAGSFALDGDLAPTQITGDQNDYNPANLATANTLYLNTDASHNITGLQGGSDGRILFVHNNGSNNFVLKNESASSSAAHRFDLGADLTVTPSMLLILQYDSTAQRWRAVAGGGGSGGTVTSITAGTGLTGGTITTSGTIALDLAHANTWTALQTFSSGLTVSGGTLTLPNGSVTNAMLASSSLTVTAGAGLSGGGSVSLGGSVTVSLDTTHANTWTAAQTIELDGLGGTFTAGLTLQNLTAATSGVPNQESPAEVFTAQHWSVSSSAQRCWAIFNGGDAFDFALGDGVHAYTVYFALDGSTGAITTGTWNASKIGLAYGGTNADLSATGGTGKYLKQASVGAAITVTTIPASDIASGAALTEVDDTNVKLILGGSPSTALLAAASITVGWAGTLAVNRGGLGVGTLPSAGQVPVGNAGGTAYAPQSLNGSGFTFSISSAGVVTISGITNAMLATAPANTIKGNNTSSTANDSDLTPAQVNAMLATSVGLFERFY